MDFFKSIKIQDCVQAHTCFCVGPQDGKPLCPCRMENIKIVKGRYVEVIDHGPAPEAP